MSVYLQFSRSYRKIDAVLSSSMSMTIRERTVEVILNCCSAVLLRHD
jgi:hypothetical protein